uniref:Uncharacterized protein n=1 Tax=Aegilops tauschii subsp. strangulata TaxID=200361 RepID=A0A453K036_AEGTS
MFLICLSLTSACWVYLLLSFLFGLWVALSLFGCGGLYQETMRSWCPIILHLCYRFKHFFSVNGARSRLHLAAVNP